MMATHCLSDSLDVVFAGLLGRLVLALRPPEIVPRVFVSHHGMNADMPHVSFSNEDRAMGFALNGLADLGESAVVFREINGGLESLGEFVAAPGRRPEKDGSQWRR